MGLNADKYILEGITGLKYDYISSLSSLMASFLNTSFEVAGKHPFVSGLRRPRFAGWSPIACLGKLRRWQTAATFSFNQMQRFCIIYFLQAGTIVFLTSLWDTSQWPHSTFAPCILSSVEFSFGGNCGMHCATVPGASHCEQTGPAACCMPPAGSAGLCTYQLMHWRAKYALLCVPPQIFQTNHMLVV